MADYKTLRVPEDAWEEAKAQKEANDRTWGEQIVEAGDVESGVEIDSEELAEELATELTEQLSKKLGSDLEQAAYRGSKDAVESVVR